MGKTSKKFIPAASCLVMLAFTLSACGSAGVPLDKFEYKNQTPISSDINDFSNVDGIALDGVKDDCYGEKIDRLYSSNDYDSEVFLDSYLYFGESGVHCFVEVHDNIVSYNSRRAVYYNSSVELFFNDINKSSIGNKTCQYRIAAGGSYTKLCGVGGRSTYTSSYFDGEFATKILGSINNDYAKGFNVEVFIPYYELGFERSSDVSGLSYNCAYNRVTDTTGRESLTSRTRTVHNLCFQATPLSWVPVGIGADGAGVCLTERGDFFGEVDGYKSSTGVNLSKDSGEYTGKASIDRASSASYAFIRDYKGTNFYYECYVKNVTGIASASPKAGISVMFPSNRIVLYLLSRDKARVGVVQRNAVNSDWNWTVEDGGCYTNADCYDPDDDYLSGVKLAVYRKDELLCFFVNDELYFSTDSQYDPKAATVRLHDTETEYFNGIGYSDDCVLGFYGFSATAAFEKYSLLTCDSANAKFSELIGMGNHRQ